MARPRPDGLCQKGLHDLTIPGSKRRRQCRACDDLRVAANRPSPVVRVCPVCATAFTVSGKSAARRVFCSRPCRLASLAARAGARRVTTRVCGVCGTNLTAKGRGRSRFCSEPCSRAAENGRRRDKDRHRALTDSEWVAARRLGHRAWRKLRRADPEYLARENAYNREREYLKYRTDPAYRLRRVQRSYGTGPVADAAMWLEQDGKCYLCGGQMNPTPIYLDSTRYDPLLVTVDHLLPRSRGGTHERENVKLAHYRCNQRKYARTPEEYLAA